MKDIIVTTECVADLPEDMVKENGIKVIYYDIDTDNGTFRDTSEIDSYNVVEYMMGGKRKIYSRVPTAKDYKGFFERNLKEHDKVFHICLSSKISKAYENANAGRQMMGDDMYNVHIIDSEALSGGMGIVTLEAVKCRKMGMNCEEIALHLRDFIPRVSTSFMANNADYLYYNGKVSKLVMILCKALLMHPVLVMDNGKLTVKKIYIGDYDKAAAKYVRYIINNSSEVDTKLGFLTYVECSEDTLTTIREVVSKNIEFDDLYEQQASATISSNSGPRTFGLLFVRKG